MTVPTLESVAEFVTNGVTTNFPFFFKFLANEDLVVTYIDPLGISVVLTLGTQYTVNGAGDDSGGSIVTGTALAGPGQLVVAREMDAYQQTSLRNQGKFLAETHEDVFDKLTMLIQQGFSLFKRALVRPYGKAYYHAENRLISNVADPVADQDAATKRWSREYIAALIGAIQGPINNALNIFYKGPDNLDYVVQDMSSPTGADLIGYRIAPSSVYDKLSESVSAADYGATVTSSNNTTAINSAIVAAGVRGRVYLGGSYKITPPLTNTHGVTFFGPGALITAAQVPADGFRQVTTYADENPIGIGREYLNRCYQYFALGQSGSGGTLRINLYGDSTVIGGNGESANFNPKACVERIFLNKGIPNVVVTNRGIGGSQISAHVAQAVTDLASNPGLYILKSFINEGTQALATRLADTETQLENFLSSVRNAAGGSLGGLAIIVMGPNSTNNTRYQRDALWYEQLRGMIVAKCRKWGACYFDTYSMLQDTLQASTIGYMDQPYPDRLLDSVHPLNAMNSQIWGGMLNWAFPDESLHPYRTTQFANTGSINGTAVPTTPPDQFPMGVTINRATTAGGWPEDGMVITTRSVDNIACQELVPFAVDRTRKITRSANVSGNSWNKFTGTVYPITFLNSWVDYDPAGVSYAVSGAILTADGMVRVQFAAKNGVITSGTNLATLPVGLRPVSPEYFTAYLAGGGVGNVAVNPNGMITAVGAVNATLTAGLSMIFRAA